MKSKGKPGIVRECFIIFIQVWEKSGKTDFVTLFWCFGKWLFHLSSVNVKFITLHGSTASIFAFPITYIY